MQKIIYIVGPTGVGKTELAFQLANDINGDLVSADSIQVYKGLDIISGKDISPTSKFVPLPELIKNGYNTGFYIDRGIRIFLLDTVEPTFSFSVSVYQELASDTIDYIHSQNKTPIVVGGTGLYVKSLLEPIGTVSIKPDLNLRPQLNSLSVSELQNLLPPEKLKTLNNSDINNPRRLIRAIEVLKHKTKDIRQKTEEKTKTFENLVIGLRCDKKVLKRRIDARVDARLKQEALEEAKSLFENYEKLAPQIKDANGYKQLFEFLQNKISLEEAVRMWKISEYRHAKNQMTWFLKYGNAQWFDITKKGFEKDVLNSLKKFIS